MERWNDGTKERKNDWASGRGDEGANYPEVQINIVKQKTKRI